MRANRIIISDKQNITLSVSSGTTAITDHSGGNIRQGYDVTYPLTGVYVMGILDGTIGFFLPKNEIVPAHKAYLYKKNN